MGSSLPLVEALVQIVGIIRKRGEVSSHELLEKLSRLKKRTFWRALNALERAELVKQKERGVYVWYVHVFENEAELRAHLRHSRKLIPGLKSLYRAYKVKDLTEGEATPAYVTCAQMHLRTGYEKIYDIYKKSQRKKVEIQRKEKQFFETVNERLGKLSLLRGIVYPDTVAKVMLDDIKSVLRSGKPSFTLSIEGDEVKADKHVLGKKEAADQLKEFIEKEEASAENRNLCSQILKLARKYCEHVSKLEREVNHLILKVENAEPLLGTCDLCPKLMVKAGT